MFNGTSMQKEEDRQNNEGWARRMVVRGLGDIDPKRGGYACGGDTEFWYEES